MDMAMVANTIQATTRTVEKALFWKGEPIFDSIL